MDLPKLPTELPGGTKLTPKVVVIVVGGGVAAGLLWRRFSGKSSGSVPATSSGVAGIDPDLALPTVGGSAGGGGGGSSSALPDGTDRRDVVGQGINLPVTKWIVTIGGVDYSTDGETLTPLGPSTPSTPAPSTPAPSAATVLSNRIIRWNGGPDGMGSFIAFLESTMTDGSKVLTHIADGNAYATIRSGTPETVVGDAEIASTINNAPVKVGAAPRWLPPGATW